MNLWKARYLTNIYTFFRSPKVKIPPRNKIKIISDLQYSTIEDRLRADIYLPLDGKNSHPTIIMLHAGGWYARSKEDMEWNARFYSSRGYTVVNMNYRLAPAHLYPAPIEDLKAAFEWVLKNSEKFQVDPAHISLMGYSAGAHITSLFSGWVTQNRPGYENFKHRAVIAGGIPADFMAWPLSPYVHRFTTFYRDQNVDLYLDASPLTHISQKSVPHFLYHARKDSLVEYEQMTKVENKLREHGVKVETYTEEKWDHTTTFLLAPEAVIKSFIFLDKL